MMESGAEEKRLLWLSRAAQHLHVIPDDRALRSIRNPAGLKKIPGSPLRGAPE